MTRPSDRPGGPSVGRDALLAAAVSLTVVAFYVVRYPLSGIRVSLGSDTPVYVWWARFSGAEGIGSFRTAGRPASVAAMATLSRVTGASAAAVAAALGPVLAAALGLALAVLVQSAWGRDRTRFVLTGLLASIFLTLMVAGYLSTLAFGALFAGSVACLGESLGRAPGAGRRGGRALVASSVLLGAAGLAHVQFLALAAAALAGAAVALLPAWRRDRAAGVPFVETSFGTVLIAGAGGVAVAGAGLGATVLGGHSPVQLDTSRDAFLRRTGLSGPLAQSYRHKLRHDFPWYRVVALVGLAASGLVSGARPEARTDRARLLWGVLAGWLALTLGGLGLLLGGVGSPAQRLAAFCLPVPVLAAAGLARAVRRDAGERAPPALRLIGAGLGVALFALVAGLSWSEQRPLISPSALDQARRAGAYLGGQPAGTPLILVADDRGGKPSLFVTRYANYLRDAVPAARVPDVFVFPGSVMDFLAGGPTLTGRPEHDRLARDGWAAIRPVLGRHPVAVVIEGFDPVAYREALRVSQTLDMPERDRLGPGVLLVPGFGGTISDPTSERLSAELRVPGPGPQSPWAPVWLAPLVLVLLAAVGWPWARLTLPGGDGLLIFGLAPAFGLASIGLSSVAADAAGMRLSAAGGLVAPGVALGAGVALWLGGRLKPPEPAPGEATPTGAGRLRQDRQPP
jgi:hypothetical protein